MNRFLIAGVCVASLCVASGVQAQGTYDAKWIAANTSNPAAATKAWFRTEVRSKQPSTGLARVVADGDFTLFGKRPANQGSEDQEDGLEDNL